MIEYVSKALASLGSATKIISSLLDLREFRNYAAQLTELQSHIIQANSHIISEQQLDFLLTAKIQELENECMRLKDWSAEKEHYALVQIADGVFAYVPNDGMGNLQAAHKLCCNCFNKTIKSILQQSHGKNRSIILTCQNGCTPLDFYYYITNKAT